MALPKQYIISPQAMTSGFAMAGFTLFEVILAMSILAALFGLVLPGVFRVMQYDVVTATQAHIAFVVEDARVHAFTQDWDERVEVAVAPDHIVSSQRVPAEPIIRQTYVLPAAVHALHSPFVFAFNAVGEINGVAEMQLEHSTGVFVTTVLEGGLITE